MACEKNTAPHIFSSASIPKIIWETSAATLPVILAALFLLGANVFRVIFFSVTAAVTVECLTALLQRKKPAIYNGSGVLTAVLFAVFLPVEVSSGAVILGSVAAALIGKELFGGLGSYPFHPAMVGLAFLALSYPHLFEWGPSPGLSNAGDFAAGGLFADRPAWLSYLFKSDHPRCMAQVSLAAVLFGGSALLLRRLIYLEVPLVYLAFLYAVTRLRGADGVSGLGGLNIADVFVAFFIVTDSVTTPATRAGKLGFAFAAAGLGAGLRFAWGAIAGTAFSILIMNALVPWIDEGLCALGVRVGDPRREIIRGIRFDKKKGGSG